MAEEGSGGWSVSGVDASWQKSSRNAALKVSLATHIHYIACVCTSLVLMGHCMCVYFTCTDGTLHVCVLHLY